MAVGKDSYGFGWYDGRDIYERRNQFPLPPKRSWWWYHGDIVKFILWVVFIVVAVYFGVKSYAESDSYQARLHREAAQERLDAQPRVIREVDGCKVYTFKSAGYWHYFTRCPGQTATETNWTEQHGKTRVQRQETITTENK